MGVATTSYSRTASRPRRPSCPSGSRRASRSGAGLYLRSFFALDARHQPLSSFAFFGLDGLGLALARVAAAARARAPPLRLGFRLSGLGRPAAPASCSFFAGLPLPCVRCPGPRGARQRCWDRRLLRAAPREHAASAWPRPPRTRRRRRRGSPFYPSRSAGLVRRLPGVTPLEAATEHRLGCLRGLARAA